MSWDEYFMNVARVVATRATCDRKHVGAVLVRDRTILSTGYNGSIRGLPHCTEAGHMMEDGHCVATVHAEANAIIQAAKNGVAIEGATIYTTASPCWPCFKLIANAGCRRIVFGEFYRDNRIFEYAQRIRDRARRAEGPRRARRAAGRHRPRAAGHRAAVGAGRRRAPRERAHEVLAEERRDRGAPRDEERLPPAERDEALPLRRAGPGPAKRASSARTSASARSIATTRIAGRRSGSRRRSISAVSFSVQSGTKSAPSTSTLHDAAAVVAARERDAQERAVARRGDLLGRDAVHVVARLVRDEVPERVGDDADAPVGRAVELDRLQHVRVVPEDDERARVDERVRELDVLRARLRLVLDAPVERDDHRVGLRRGGAHVLDDARAVERARPAGTASRRPPAAGRRSRPG